MFGSTTTPSFGAFGSMGNQQQPQQQAGGMFGNNMSQQQQMNRQSSGLFGASSTLPNAGTAFGSMTPAASSPFGNLNNQVSAPSSSLFGSAAQANTQPQQSMFGQPGGFGASTAPTTSMFGGTSTATPFGMNTQQNQQQQPNMNSFSQFGGGIMNNGMGMGMGGANGTATVPYQMTRTVENNAEIENVCILMMDAYKKKSLTELRLEDYAAGRMSKPANAMSNTMNPLSTNGGMGMTGFGSAGISNNNMNNSANSAFGAPTSSFNTGGMFSNGNVANNTQSPFGQQPNTNTGGSLFGTTNFNNISNTGTGTGTNAFSSTTSLFGAQPATNNTTSVFGQSAGPFSNQTQQPNNQFGQQQPGSGGLFSNASNGTGFNTGMQQPSSTTSLFGAQNNTAQPQSVFGSGFNNSTNPVANNPIPAANTTSSLFSNQTTNPQPTSGFGSFGTGVNNTTATNNNNTTSSGLFGSQPSIATPQTGFNTGSSLFGNNTTINSNNSGLLPNTGFNFGATNNNNNTLGAVPSSAGIGGNNLGGGGGGLFNNFSTNSGQQNTAGSSLFGSSLFSAAPLNQQHQQQQQQQQQQQPFNNNLFNSNNMSSNSASYNNNSAASAQSIESLIPTTNSPYGTSVFSNLEKFNKNNEGKSHLIKTSDDGNESLFNPVKKVYSDTILRPEGKLLTSELRGNNTQKKPPFGTNIQLPTKLNHKNKSSFRKITTAKPIEVIDLDNVRDPAYDGSFDNNSLLQGNDQTKNQDDISYYTSISNPANNYHGLKNVAQLISTTAPGKASNINPNSITNFLSPFENGPDRELKIRLSNKSANTTATSSSYPNFDDDYDNGNNEEINDIRNPILLDQSNLNEKTQLALLKEKAEIRKSLSSLEKFLESHPDYYISPSVDVIVERYMSGKNDVLPFVIGRTSIGEISWHHGVDIRNIDFNRGIVRIYRNKRLFPLAEVYLGDDTKPRRGSGLNKPATITLYSVFYFDKVANKVISDPKRLKAMDYELALKKHAENNDSEHLLYSYNDGTWTFNVNHFSRYGPPGATDDEDEYDDASCDEYDMQAITRLNQDSSIDDMLKGISSESEAQSSEESSNIEYTSFNEAPTMGFVERLAQVNAGNMSALDLSKYKELKSKLFTQSQKNTTTTKVALTIAAPVTSTDHSYANYDHTKFLSAHEPQFTNANNNTTLAMTRPLNTTKPIPVSIRQSYTLKPTSMTSMHTTSSAFGQGNGALKFNPIVPPSSFDTSMTSSSYLQGKGRSFRASVFVFNGKVIKVSPFNPSLKNSEHNVPSNNVQSLVPYTMTESTASSNTMHLSLPMVGHPVHLCYSKACELDNSTFKPAIKSISSNAVSLLCSIIFTNSDKRNYESNLEIKHHVQKWLFQHCPISTVSANQYIPLLLNALYRGNIAKASQLCLQNKDFRLAMIVSQVPLSNNARLAVQSQLDTWKTQSVPIDMDYLRIYKLLGGRVCDLVELCHNMDWMVAFNIFLTYYSTSNDHFDDIFFKFDDLVREGTLKLIFSDKLVSKNDSNNSQDSIYQLFLLRSSIFNPSGTTSDRIKSALVRSLYPLNFGSYSLYNDSNLSASLWKSMTDIEIVNYLNIGPTSSFEYLKSHLNSVFIQ